MTLVSIPEELYWRTVLRREGVLHPGDLAGEGGVGVALGVLVRYGRRRRSRISRVTTLLVLLVLKGVGVAEGIVMLWRSGTPLGGSSLSMLVGFVKRQRNPGRHWRLAR